MATLLTKSSFGGGGWLTQKLRGLGEGVPVLMGLLAERVSHPHGCLNSTDPSSDLLCLWRSLGLCYSDPSHVNVMKSLDSIWVWPESQPQLDHWGRPREASDLGYGAMDPAPAPAQALPGVRNPVLLP